MQSTIALLAASAAAMLAAHSGSAQAARLCRPLHSNEVLSMVGVTPATTTVVVDAGDVLDGDFKSGATIRAQSAAGTASATFSGSFATSHRDVAGVLLELPPEPVTVSVTIKTYKDDHAIDGATLTAPDGPCVGVCETQGGQSFFGIKTTGSFDRVSATVRVSGTSQATRVLELCGR